MMLSKEQDGYDSFEDVSIQESYQKPKRRYTLLLPVLILSLCLGFACWQWRRPRVMVWQPFSGNPVLPTEEDSDAVGIVFDLGLLREDGLWKMYNSWRPQRSIGFSTSPDGLSWTSPPQIALGPNVTSDWDTDVNRPFVLKKNSQHYMMWYTGQSSSVGGWIGVAESTDGQNFVRTRDQPVMKTDLWWETESVMTPTIVELENDVLRMYYAAGDRMEPNAIGVAHSFDGGYSWIKHGDPVLIADPSTTWDNHKVTSPHVFRLDGWHYMFYVGFCDEHTASIGVVRSRDGLTDWQRSTSNPIVEKEPGAWNCDATYKPFAAWDEASSRWLLWYNGRCGNLERIGVATLSEKSFGRFVPRRHVPRN